MRGPARTARKSPTITMDKLFSRKKRRIDSSLLCDFGECADREGGSLGDPQWDGEEAKPASGQGGEVGEVLHDGDVRSQQTGVNWAGGVGHVIDVPEVDTHNARAGPN